MHACWQLQNETNKKPFLYSSPYCWRGSVKSVDVIQVDSLWKRRNEASNCVMFVHVVVLIKYKNLSTVAVQTSRFLTGTSKACGTQLFEWRKLFSNKTKKNVNIQKKRTFFFFFLSKGIRQVAGEWHEQKKRRCWKTSLEKEKGSR